MSTDQHALEPLRATPRSNSRAVGESTGLLVGIFFVFAVLRLSISFEALATYLHYTIEGSSMLEKIHPASYGLILIFGVIYLYRPLVCDVRDRPILRASAIVIVAESALLVLELVTGRVRALSFALDSILQGPLIVYIMVFVSDKDRRTIFNLLIYALILNDIVLFIEYATHYRIGAYAYSAAEAAQSTGYFFRPAAFLNHPLVDGAVNATAIPFAWLMPWSLQKRVALAFFFLLAAFAAQARIASLLSVIAFLGGIWVMLREMQRRRQIDVGAMSAALVGALMTTTIALVIIAVSGLAERLLGLGLGEDKSSQSRFLIYQIFRYMTRHELLFGMDTTWSNYLVTTVLGLTASESWIVNGVMFFGIIGSVVVFPALFFFMWRLQTNAKNGYIVLGVLCAMCIALQGTALTTKRPMLMFDTLIVLSAVGAVRAKASESRTNQLRKKSILR